MKHLRVNPSLRKLEKLLVVPILKLKGENVNVGK